MAVIVLVFSLLFLIRTSIPKTLNPAKGINIPVKNLRCRFQGINTNAKLTTNQITIVFPSTLLQLSARPNNARIKQGDKEIIRSMTSGDFVIFCRFQIDKTGSVIIAQY
jgi:hypothetical protein